MENRSNGIYNIISILFIVLTVLVLVFVIIQMASPPPGDSGQQTVQLPTELVLPSQTPLPPSETPRPTLPPTFTPTPTDTVTPSRTPTPTNTIPPTATITDTPLPGPTQTPSTTPLPPDQLTQQAIQQQPEIPSNTPIGPTQIPTPTQSPFLFNIQSNGVTFGPNGVNTLGCAWQGMGGSVLDQNGLELAGQYRVNVYGEGFQQVVNVGSSSQYGAISGWEVAVSNTINNRTYYVRLETSFGTVISPDIPVTFPGDCNSNAALVRFVQTRSLNPAQAGQQSSQPPINNSVPPPFAPPVTTPQVAPPTG